MNSFTSAAEWLQSCNLTIKATFLEIETNKWARFSNQWWSTSRLTWFWMKNRLTSLSFLLFWANSTTIRQWKRRVSGAFHSKSRRTSGPDFCTSDSPGSDLLKFKWKINRRRFRFFSIRLFLGRPAPVRGENEDVQVCSGALPAHVLFGFRWREISNQVFQFPCGQFELIGPKASWVPSKMS